MAASHPFGEARRAGAATPVILVVGPRGSGKSSLLSGVAGDVVVDEVDEATREIGGCICCTVRTDLQDTLTDLARTRRTGEARDVARVFIESRSDPASVIQTLIVDPDLARQYRLARVCTVVDAAAGELTPLLRKQVALADTLLLTRTDLAPAASRDALVARLRRLNPLAPIHEVRGGTIDPALLREPATDGLPPDWSFEPAADGEIMTFSLAPERQFPQGAAETFLETLTRLRGADLLRFRGLFNVAGAERPLMIAGVHHVFQPPRYLARWPGNDRSSRLVFVTRDLRRETVEGLMAPFLDAELFPTG